MHMAVDMDSGAIVGVEIGYVRHSKVPWSFRLACVMVAFRYF